MSMKKFSEASLKSAANDRPDGHQSLWMWLPPGFDSCLNSVQFQQYYKNTALSSMIQFISDS